MVDGSLVVSERLRTKVDRERGETERERDRQNMRVYERVRERIEVLHKGVGVVQQTRDLRLKLLLH